MTDDAPPLIVFVERDISIDPPAPHHGQDFTVFWQEVNQGGSSDGYTDVVRVTYADGKGASSDLTCTPLAAGESAMRQIVVTGGIPTGDSAKVEVWVAYDLHGMQDSGPHYRSQILTPAHNAAPGHSGSAPAYPGHALRLHSHGEAVHTWQQRLADLGHELTPDASFGTATEHHTRQFQHDKGLTEDGVVGPATWAAAWS